MGVKIAFAFLPLWLSIPGTALAADISTWNPTNGIDWNTPQNWLPEAVPDSGATVMLNSGSASLGSLTGSTSISALQNTGSASAGLYLASGGTLTVTNGITATSNLTVNVSGGPAEGTLNLGGTNTLPGSVFVNSSGTVNLQSGATANLQFLSLDGGGGLEAVATVANGAALTTNNLFLSSNIGILGVNGTGTATVNNAFNVSGQVTLNQGGTLSLTGTQDLGQAYGGGPELHGGYLTNGAYIAAGNGSGTLNLGSDVSMGGLTNGTLTSGYEANSNLTVNNTAGRTITIAGGNIGTLTAFNQVILTGNMNFVGTSIDGGAGGVVLQGANNFVFGGTTWSDYVNLANGSVTTVSGGIFQGSDPLTVNLLGNAQLTVNNGGNAGVADIQGTYNVAPNASLTLDDAYLDGATVNTSGNFYVPNGYSQTAGTTEVNGLMNAGASTVSITGGIFQGDGTVDAGDVSVSNGATIKPGDSPGILTINGDLTLAADATTLIQYGGKDNSDPSDIEYDAFAVNGTADLNGYLDTEYMDLGIGYTPAVGDEFTIMTCTVACDGTFSGLYDYVSPDEFFQLDYTGTSVELIVESGTPTSPPPSSTPEPGTWLLLASGLAAALIRRRNVPAATAKY